MAPRTRSNPLALAVLTCLYERPMHPYEISQTLRMRGTDQAVRLNFGSLYSVVTGLERRELIEAVETVREGRRPERTIYAITDRGTAEMNEWLADLLTVPVKEYLQFEAGLALVAVLPPDEVASLLRQRYETLDIQLDQSEAALSAMEKRGLPRLFLLEGEYQVALRRAELVWIRQLVADIESGTLGGIEPWRAWHESGRREWPQPHGADWSSIAAAATEAGHETHDEALDSPDSPDRQERQEDQ
jgi:DNA-binding PadR family transcriptional regulator